MFKEVKAKVHKETKEGTYFFVLVPHESLTDKVKKFTDNGILKGELRIDDGRHITAEQRKRAYATLADIATHLGYPPEELKEIMKYRFVAATGNDYFSFRNCSITTARHFVNFIIDFALEWGIPLSESLIDRTDDINAAIYSSLKHKRCIVCGKEGEVHHWIAIGMGQDREKFDDSRLPKLCICRLHHNESHQIGNVEFEKKYHVYGIVYKE